MSDASQVHCRSVADHYERRLRTAGKHWKWQAGPMPTRFPDFHILVVPPSGARSHWFFGTCGMSLLQRSGDLELHAWAPAESERHVESLTAVAYFHLTSTQLVLDQAINLGRPWIEGGACDHGLVSLQSLFESSLIGCRTAAGFPVACHWLVPITTAEFELKREHGIDALSRHLSVCDQLMDPGRSSLV